MKIAFNMLSASHGGGFNTYNKNILNQLFIDDDLDNDFFIFTNDNSLQSDKKNIHLIHVPNLFSKTLLRIFWMQFILPLNLLFKKVDILLSPEKNNKRDFMFFRNSGLNQVLCKLAVKNHISIGFNFSDILNSNGKERSKLLGRMTQNVRLCKKYKVKMEFSSFAKNKFELRSDAILTSFAKVLGF